jgi:hypothetical protein
MHTVVTTMIPGMVFHHPAAFTHPAKVDAEICIFHGRTWRQHVHLSPVIVSKQIIQFNV